MVYSNSQRYKEKETPSIVSSLSGSQEREDSSPASCLLSDVMISLVVPGGMVLTGDSRELLETLQ